MVGNIDRRARRIIGKHLKVPLGRILPAACLVEDLGADSLALAELALTFEVAFEICLPETAVAQLRTVQDALECIQKHLPAAAL